MSERSHGRRVCREKERAANAHANSRSLCYLAALYRPHVVLFGDRLPDVPTELGYRALQLNADQTR